MQDTAKLIIDAIKPLAEKLGQGAAHLYEVYVRQQYITGITEYVWTAFLILVAIGLLVVGIKSIQRGGKMREEDRGSDYEIWYAFGIIIVGIAIVVAFISVAVLQFAIQTTLNPEYYAVQDVINTVKGSK